MTTFKPILIPLIAALGILGIVAPAPAPDEGMWPFHALPLEKLKEKYGFEPTPAWLEHVQLSSLKISSGGSGSFVSAEGLVATNHHVALEFINHLATKDNDLVEKGFLATKRSEELKCEGANVKQLMSVDDVTQKIVGAARAGTPAGQIAALRQRAIQQMQADESGKTGLNCEVISMHGGSQYFMYRYKTYDDVRLVFAPEKQIAYFGGDRDNFCYPRFCLDCSFLRVYENGEPAKTENYLKWSTKGVSEKDLIFISGNPASTGRYETMAELAFKRDVRLPAVLQLIRDRERALTAYGEGSKERLLEVLDEVFGLRNSDKALTGNHKALNTAAIWGELARKESEFRKSISEDAEAIAAYEQIEGANKTLSGAFPTLIGQRLDGAIGTTAQRVVATVMRMGQADEAAAKRRAEQIAETSFNLDLEEARLRAALETGLGVLGADHAFVKAALGDLKPAEAAKKLARENKLGDVAFLTQLFQGGPEGLKQCTEPIIKLALIMGESRQAIMSDYQGAMGASTGAHPAIAKARFGAQGSGLYPDATFTLRLSFGEVKGYELGTTDVPWKTTLWGLYGRNSSFGNAAPYSLPERWLKAKEKVDLDTPVNFVSTADTTGGNSGSPVIDRQGNLVGLLFDGNIQSLLVDNLYEEEVSRSVCVDARFMGHALEKVYGADALVKELGIK